MYSIKFSHFYDKMKPFDLKRPFKLLTWFISDAQGLSPPFKEYDTAYDGGKYSLPTEGDVIILLLEQDGKLMTTIRSYGSDKADFYSSMIGEQVMVRVKEA